MTVIRSLFDPSRDISRSIEKVITYQASHEERLRAEISEYVVTDRIEEQLERLLEKVQAAMDFGGGHEIGVWVSGFYGSGKSSFTKYLGLAFDGHYVIDGQPFLKHLQNRVQRATTRALLSTVASRFPAAIVMLDLASEQIAGAMLAEVSTVLYYKVLQYAGYSRNLKVAAFERKLKKDGRYAEFEDLFQTEAGAPWKDYQNDELVADGMLPGLAHRMYPTLFRTDHAFTTTASDVIYLMDDRVKEMIDLVRDVSGKENIIFVIDEIGQYVGSNQNKILDLQGLAQNLKDIGGGTVWIVGTAQQTLTEDDPRIAINSPELFKLKDRFPITVELESSDIREICYRRLLGKSPDGERLLAELFDRHGAQLRHNTRLVDAKSYSATLDRNAFVNLYPFLPAHFDILLHLLGALAKSTGGIGLRSAIKVVQDILVEGTGRGKPVADQTVGWLATTVTLFDSLDRDILRAYPQIHQAVKKTLGRVGDDALKQNVAKTIAILQILNNLPANAQNVASLMQAGVDADAMTDRVKAAVDEMLKDQFVPLMEKDGNLRFFSEKLNDIEQERGQINVRTQDFRRIFNTALREVFDPLPTVKVHDSLSVTSGVRHLTGGQALALAGERETIQTLVAFAEAGDYDAQRTRLLDESREKANETANYLLGRTAPGAVDLVTDIYRCERIAELHRNEPDQEVREYCAGQTERTGKLMGDLRVALARSLSQGSFLFRGRATAVDSLDQDLGKAARAHLAVAAAQVFDRYPEAPVRVETVLAEKFLRQPNLRSITSQLDPLGLVELGSAPKVKTSHKGLVSIHDFIERTGTVEGKSLLEAFSDYPFGWSQDTLRYMVAALLLAAEIKLKVAGREVTVNGQQAIDALKTNTSFRLVGVSLRHDRPSMEVLARAAERLTELCGEQVLPLEDEISKAVRQKLPDLQNRLSPLSERLSTLGLPGADTMDTINQQVASMLQTDASDAPQRFGAAEAPLFDGLMWAIAVKNAFDQGLSDTIRNLREIARTVTELPGTGVPGELRDDVQEDLDLVGQRLAQKDFHKHKADLATQVTTVEARIAEAVRAMVTAQKERLRDAERDLRLLPEWVEFTQDEQAGMLNRLQAMAIMVDEDLAGLTRLLSRQFDIEGTITQLKDTIVRDGCERRRERELPSYREDGLEDVVVKQIKVLALPRRIVTTAQLNALIDQLQELRAEIAFAEFNVDSGGLSSPMAFDDSTRGRLQSFVGAARDLLAGEFAWQLQQTYGMDPTSGEVAGLDRLGHLDDQRLETARLLREILEHYLGAAANPSVQERRHALDRIVREQAFTVLNRLAALRLMEARGILLESVAHGYQSKGFQLYQRVAGSALGETGDAYRIFLFSLFDLFTTDLPALFDRHSPFGRLFPREATFLRLVDLLNALDLDPLWGKDETIGWIYQYFNSTEERRRMRKESGAPRNSRELAVRNQFFTPRYIVEFLIDNTLGKFWFTSIGGQTELRDRCQYLLVKPGESSEPAHRLRDPRTIKLLDPACGSMHFGIYAFDLFQTIYREAWGWEQTHGPGSLDIGTGGSPDLKPLCQTYADENTFLHDVPRLIIEYNIYGVEIDPRAAQIASLALWLRAQRAWHDIGARREARPTIGRGHVVAAVAPPVELDLRRKLTAGIDHLDAELLERTLFLLKGLPELGVLLRAEREVPALVRQVLGSHGEMFRKEDEAQWRKAETRLRAALEDFARSAAATYRNRLFAEDALEGLRLIDLVGEIFDTVVMNPPFGALSAGVKDGLGRVYPRSKNDLLAIFVERGLELLCPGGRLGAITSRTCFFLTSYQRWRDEVVLGIARPEIVADLGYGVMDDAMVEAAAYVLKKQT